MNAFFPLLKGLLYLYSSKQIAMNRIRIFILILLGVVSLKSFGQDGLPIGSWRTHLPFQKVIDVEVFGQKIYAATEYELFYYDQEDNSINKLNKINGLSDIGISKIRYCKDQNLLFVGYTNTNIDLIYPDGDVVNLSDIKDKSILGNKVINNVVFYGHYAYVACGFGIVVIDTERLEVKDTYYIGPLGAAVNVTDIAFFNGKIYASTDEGVYFASMDAQNLAYYAAWSHDTTLSHPHGNYNQLEVFAGHLLLNYDGGVNDTIFYNDGSQWSVFEPAGYSSKYELRACDGQLIICNAYSVSVFDELFERTYQIYNPGGSIIPLSAVADATGTFWIGDNGRGMIRTTDGWNNMDVLPNGPYSKNSFHLQACGDQVWVSSGGHAGDWSPRYMREGVFRFNGMWTNFNRKTSNDFAPFFDFVCSATNPWDPSVTYVGTWGSGVLKIVDDELVEVYNAENSTLDYWISNPSLINISGLAFDSKGNLWVANTGATSLLSVMEPDGTWHSYNLGGTYSGIDISTLTVDSKDNKWIIRRTSTGTDSQILVFNDNGSLDITSDDQVVALSKNVGGLPGNVVNCIAVDRKGYVWLGTDMGVCVFYDSDKIFTTPGYTASEVRIPRNDGTGQYDPLFDGSNVLAIAVDGGGSKWFGLETGAYLISEDNSEFKCNFTMDNSPLLDNSVQSIAIDKEGEVFFATDNGLISFKGTATPFEPENSDVVVYPNPVEPGFSGYVGIKGLVQDALVKITAVDGAFVTSLQAEGGQAVWDCTTIDGQKVRPGVYLIFVSTSDGFERYATKILIMN